MRTFYKKEKTPSNLSAFAIYYHIHFGFICQQLFLFFFTNLWYDILYFTGKER